LRVALGPLAIAQISTGHGEQVVTQAALRYYSSHYRPYRSYYSYYRPYGNWYYRSYYRTYHSYYRPYGFSNDQIELAGVEPNSIVFRPQMSDGVTQPPRLLQPR